tara:strand:- start:31762 stop:32190 length:429 start_codon:yes stop_codon:yes gene_type:complete
MDLLSVTPTLSTAKFKFLDLDSGKPVSTNKDNEMFVEIMGANSKERQELTRQYHARNAKMFLEKGISKPEDLPADGEAKEEIDKNLKESSFKFLQDITVSLLVQIKGKESTSKKTFYGEPDFQIWFEKIDVFAGTSANFIKA